MSIEKDTFEFFDKQFGIHRIPVTHNEDTTEFEVEVEDDTTAEEITEQEQKWGEPGEIDTD